ncbi:cysteine-rich receptor-like protein kinase 8 [Tanacetum coccineum]
MRCDFAGVTYPITKLNHDDGDPLDDPYQYRALVGILLYLTITGPEISYVAQTLSQFIQAPRTPHLKTLVKVLRYLKSCPGQCLIFQGNTTLNLKAFCDSDWASCSFSRRSVTDVTRELLWIKCLFKDLGLTISSPTSVYCDNASAIAFASNPVQHARTKHIEIDCHFERDKIRQGLILPTFIPTQHQFVVFLLKRKKREKELKNFMQRGIIFCWEWSSIYRQEILTVVSAMEPSILEENFEIQILRVGDEEVVVEEGVVVTSSSLDILTNSCLGGIMVNLIFLVGLEEEALVEFMVEWCEEDEDDDRSEEGDLFN